MILRSRGQTGSRICHNRSSIIASRALRTAIAITHKDAELDDILAEGYFDQSHLIREMKHFTGMTPAAFAAQPTVFNTLIAKRSELERSHPLSRKSLIT